MRYPSLDLIRGVGAIAVVFFHLGLVWHIAPYGYLAVDVFFCLSGYVMAMTYELNLQSSLGMDVREFMALRIRRLYPTYLVGIGLGTIVVIAKGVWLTPWAFLNVFMLPAPVSGEMFPLNVPAWSLFFELIAYLYFAAMAKVLVRTSTLVLIVVTSGCALLANGGIGNSGSTWVEFLLGLARLGFAFPLGWLLWRWRFRPWALPAVLNRPAAMLGAASYPLYIIHYPLLSPLQLACRKLGVSGPVPAIAIVVVLVALAWGLDRLMRPRRKANTVRYVP